MNKTVNNTKPEENISSSFNAEKAPQFPFLFRRFFEFLLSSLVCSVPIALLYGIGVIPKSDYWGLRVMGISLFAFVFINAYLLRAFYYSMGNKRIYYNVNIVGYIIFAVINIAIFIIFKDEHLPSFYSYLFMPMKFFNVILNMLGSTASMRIQILAPIATHILMILVIFASPLEMYTFDKKRK